MSRIVRGIFGLALVAAFGSAHAVQCIKPGHTSVFHSKDRTSILFFSSHPEGDLTFTVPGQNFEFDRNAPPQKIEYFLEGVHYEFITTGASEFIKHGEANGPREILARHAQSELAWATDAGSELTKFTVLAVTYRQAHANTPLLTFMRWKFGDPALETYPHQLFLSTVIGDSVAAFTAIVTNAEQEPLAQASLDRFASSFRFIENKDECPNTVP